jgi:predicted trehalose synthase
MVRSYRYAARASRLEGVVREEDKARLLPWEQSWSAWTAGAFLRGYFERAQAARFLPSADEGLATLLDRYVLGRALHELEGWVLGRNEAIDVPLADILHMLDD